MCKTLVCLNNVYPIFVLQERVNPWSGWQRPARCANAAWCWVIPLYLWSSGSPSSRCGPLLTTLRSAASLLMRRTSLSVARWPSAPTPCWVTPPSAPGKLKGSWSGCGAKSGVSSYWMKFTLSLVSCFWFLCYPKYIRIFISISFTCSEPDRIFWRD